MIGTTFGNSASSGGAFSGLLDDYPNASAAYSIRRLSSAYLSNILEVRRSSDNTTLNIGYDVSGNLDTVAMLSFVGAGDGFVRTWYDQSGNGNNATQITTSAQPKIIVSGSLLLLNSMPVLDMSFGASKLLVPSFAAAAPSIFTVSGLTGTGSQSPAQIGTIISGGDGLNNRFDFGSYATSSSPRIFVMESGINTKIGGSVDYFNSNQYLFSSNTTQFRTNGTTIASGTISTEITAYTNDFRVGSRYWTAGEVNSYIQTQELIFYPSNQLTNQSAIETNQNDYFTIY